MTKIKYGCYCHTYDGSGRQKKIKIVLFAVFSLLLASCEYSSVDEKQNLLKIAAKGKTIFLGDSNTFLMGDLSRYNRNFVNWGIGGSTSIDVVRLLTLTDEAAGGRVVLMIGTNDITKIVAPDILGGLECTEDFFIANYEMILCMLIQKYNVSDIYCVSILPSSPGWVGWIENRNEYTMEMNRRIKIITEKFGCNFIDEWGSFYDSGNNCIKSEYQDDVIHINAAGHDRHMANVISAIAEHENAWR